MKKRVLSFLLSFGMICSNIPQGLVVTAKDDETMPTQTQQEDVHSEESVSSVEEASATEDEETVSLKIFSRIPFIMDRKNHIFLNLQKIQRIFQNTIICNLPQMTQKRFRKVYIMLWKSITLNLIMFEWKAKKIRRKIVKKVRKMIRCTKYRWKVIGIQRNRWKSTAFHIGWIRNLSRNSL